MDPLDKGPQQLRDTLKEYFEQIRFARAAELARSRRYLEAEGLLAPNGRESTDPRELDLLALISAQQRQYERARRLWETALQQSPGNTDYERAIARTKEAERSQAISQKRTMIVLVCIAVAGFAVGLWSYLHRPSPPATVDGEKETHSLPATPSPSLATPAAAQSTAIESQPSSASSTPAPQPAASQSTPVTPQPLPATPQPAPVTPQPTPAPPQPSPAAPPVAPDNP